MKHITVTQARKDIYNLVKGVDENHEPVHIATKNASAILISETDWRAIQETLYLSSDPELHKSIKEGLNTPLDECDEDVDL